MQVVVALIWVKNWILIWIERFLLDCRKGLVLVLVWFYYALWLASVFTLVLVLRQSSENRSNRLSKQMKGSLAKRNSTKAPSFDKKRHLFSLGFVLFFHTGRYDLVWSPLGV